MNQDSADQPIVDYYRAFAQGGAVNPDNSYRGLQIHASPGLHDTVGQWLAGTLPKGASVLDLGAGSGAMALRLQDLGYAVTASDIVPDNFRLHGTVAFRELNLNRDIEGFEPVDAVVAVELIEHLENPRYFLRQCARLLKPGGTLLLTTPNIENPVSKAMFLRHGQFQWFSEVAYRHDGHISPVCAQQLRLMAPDAGLRIERLGSHGDPYRHVKGWRGIEWPARLIERVCCPDPALRGECLVVRMTRT